jgi:hypothetical protein
VIRLTGSRSRIVSAPLPADDPRQRRPEISRARSLLGWAPTVSLEEGLGRTIGYFRETLLADGKDAPAGPEERRPGDLAHGEPEPRRRAGKSSRPFQEARAFQEEGVSLAKGSSRP